MSSFIFPSRSLLKPERTWDVPRPAGLRRRPGWFRKLLGGRWGNTMLQPGSCCGCGCLCGSGSVVCAVPKSDLTLTLSTTTSGSCFSGTFALVRGIACFAGTNECGWMASIFCANTGNTFYFVLGCIGGRWSLQHYLTDPCTATAACQWDSSTATSYTCSPLFLRWAPFPTCSTDVTGTVSA